MWERRKQNYPEVIAAVFKNILQYTLWKGEKNELKNEAETKYVNKVDREYIELCVIYGSDLFSLLLSFICYLCKSRQPIQ